MQPVTATTYDATLVLGTALGMDQNPTRESVLASLKSPEFKVEQGATGTIQFNSEGTAKGDRLHEHVEFVHILQCNSPASKVGYAYFPITFTSPEC